MYNFLLPDCKLPPKVSCVANIVWISLFCFCSRSNIMQLFKVHATYDINSIHPRKSNVYAYENQTRDRRNIPVNFKSTTQNFSDGSWISRFDFVSKKEKEEKKKNAFVVLKEKKK